MDVSFFYKLLNYIKFLHWTTKSYSAHVALGKAYDELEEKIDLFVEAFMGAFPEEKVTMSDLQYTKPDINNYNGDIKAFFHDLYHDFLNNIEQYNRNSAFESIIDDMENICDQIQFLLSLK